MKILIAKVIICTFIMGMCAVLGFNTYQEPAGMAPFWVIMGILTSVAWAVTTLGENP